MADTYVGKPIGVSNLTWFPLTADPAEGNATYGTAVKLSRLIEVTLDPQFVEGLLESDNSIEDQISLLQSVDVTINASQLTDAIRAGLLGHTMDSTGGMLVKPTDAPQLGALAFKALLSKESGTDKHAYIVLYKGRFREFSETFSTVEKGTVKYQTHTGLKGTFVARDSDGHIMYRMREDSAGASSTKASAWFTSPQEYTPTKVQILSLVQKNGTSGSADTTAIEINFDKDVTDLEASHITLAAGTGAATKGTLSGSNKKWTLAITPTTEGTVSLAFSGLLGYEFTPIPAFVTIFKAAAGGA